MNDWPEIQTALLTAKNNRTLAAKMLGISRATLYRRLDKLKTDDR
nr:helix-turn-helix domain-containing protein [Vibrio metschnikovii]